MKKMIALLLSATLTVGMFAGCGNSNSSGSEGGASSSNQETDDGAAEGNKTENAEEGKTLSYVMANEPETLDPGMNNYATSSIVLQNLFLGLYQLDVEGALVEGCAESVDISEDGLVYTFTLKEGLKWSDGSALTAQDFEYAWKRCLDPETASPGAWYMYYLANGEAYNNGEASADEVGVTATDELTLVATLENPTSYFLDLTAVSCYFPIKQEVVESGETWTKSGDTYICNGAFLIDQINPNESYILKKNPNYHFDEEVNLDTLKIVFIESASAALTAFNSGEVDVVGSTSIGTQAAAQYDGQDELQYFDLIGTRYYDFNCEKEYLSDARVRKALSIALDRDTITKNLVASKPQSAFAYVPYGIPYGDTDQEFREVAGDLIAEDVERAKELLAEAGYPNGEGFPTLEYIIQNDQEQKDVAQAMQAMWKENLGIEVEITTYESSTYWDEHRAGKFDIAYDGWTGDYPDASTNLDCFTKARVTGMDSRWHGPQAEKYDELIMQSREEIDNAKRMELFVEAEQILLDDMPSIPLFYRNSNLLINAKCKNVFQNYIGHTILKYADIE